MFAHWLLAPFWVVVAALRAAADPTPAAVGVAPGGGGMMPPVAVVWNAADAALHTAATERGGVGMAATALVTPGTPVLPTDAPPHLTV